jgi:tetratricopeptide (TPR) repeat protein
MNTQKQGRIRFAVVAFAALMGCVLLSPAGAQRNAPPKGNPSPFTPGGRPGQSGSGPQGNFSPATPPGGQGGGYQEHKHSASDAPRYENKRKTPLAQQKLAEAIIDDALTRLWEQSDKHFHEGEYNHSIALNRVIIEGEPGNVDAFENSAYLLWSTDRSEEAVVMLEAGAKANPASYRLYDELGWHYYDHKKNYQKAIPYYEQAVKFKAPFFTWNNLARSYERTNQWEKALKAWEAAAKFPSPVAGATQNVTAERGIARARAELAKRNKDRN